MSTRNHYLFEHSAVFALFFAQKGRQTLKIASLPGVRVCRRGSAENTLISNVTQRKPRHAKFKSQSFFSRVSEYPVTHEQ